MKNPKLVNGAHAGSVYTWSASRDQTTTGERLRLSYRIYSHTGLGVQCVAATTCPNLAEAICAFLSAQRAN